MYALAGSAIRLAPTVANKVVAVDGRAPVPVIRKDDPIRLIDAPIEIYLLHRIALILISSHESVHSRDGQSSVPKRIVEQSRYINAV